MSKQSKLASLVLASSLVASLASASSPTPPVEARLEPDGPRAVRLVIATSASGDWAVTARRTGAEPAGTPLSAAKPLTEGIVRKGSPVLALDVVAKDAATGDLVHVNYQVEVTSSERGYRGFVAVDQAFVVESDGTLRPVTFEQELELTAGPAPAAPGNDEMAADAPSSQPRQ